MARIGRFKVGLAQGTNPMSVIRMLSMAILTIVIGGVLLQAFATVATGQTGTCSAIYDGFGILGWTVNTSSNHCVTSTSGSSGILMAVGYIAVAAVIMRYVRVSW